MGVVEVFVLLVDVLAVPVLDDDVPDARRRRRGRRDYQR